MRDKLIELYAFSALLDQYNIDVEESLKSTKEFFDFFEQIRNYTPISDAEIKEYATRKVEYLMKYITNNQEPSKEISDFYNKRGD